MSDPTLLYCAGATKAGTSWFYSALHDHPQCNLRAVKEVHYWDSFSDADQAKQLEALERQVNRLTVTRATAQAAGRQTQAANLDRRIAEVAGLAEVLAGDRTDDRAYLDWLKSGSVDNRLIADMTPSYALLPDDVLARMLRANPVTKVIYLIRDPLARLWSHVRMQANRQKQSDEDFQKKSNGILWRILNKGQETHLTERGNYVAAISKLRRCVPPDQLLVTFTEHLYTPEGWGRVCDFLGIDVAEPTSDRKVHEGQKARMRDDLAPLAVRFLQDQYDWVAANVAPLPAAWQVNLARASA